MTVVANQASASCSVFIIGRSKCPKFGSRPWTGYWNCSCSLRRRLGIHISSLLAVYKKSGVAIFHFTSTNTRNIRNSHKNLEAAEALLSTGRLLPCKKLKKNPQKLGLELPARHRTVEKNISAQLVAVLYHFVQRCQGRCMKWLLLSVLVSVRALFLLAPPIDSFSASVPLPRTRFWHCLNICELW